MTNPIARQAVLPIGGRPRPSIEPWADDLCLCGEPRKNHQKARAQWPATVGVRGRCKASGCHGFTLDAEALEEAEAAIRAERLAGCADLLRWAKGLR